MFVPQQVKLEVAPCSSTSCSCSTFCSSSSSSSCSSPGSSVPGCSPPQGCVHHPPLIQDVLSEEVDPLLINTRRSRRRNAAGSGSLSPVSVLGRSGRSAEVRKEHIGAAGIIKFGEHGKKFWLVSQPIIVSGNVFSL